MEMIAVKDSRIRSIGYDEAARTLRVEFPNTKDPHAPGSAYDYADVPRIVFDNLRSAEQQGKYFAQVIQGPDRKNPVYKYRKLSAEELGAPSVVSNVTIANPTAAYEAAAAKAAEAEVIQATQAPSVEDELRAEAESVKAKTVTIVRADGPRMVLTVNTPAAYEAAAAELIEIARKRKLAQARIDAMKKPLREALNQVLLFEKEVIGTFQNSADFIEGGLTTYRQAERDARARAEQEERLKRQRVLDAEAAERAEAQRLQAEAEAAKVEAAGQPAMAEIIRATPRPVVAEVARPVVYATEVPQVSGIAVRGTWRNRVDKPADIPLFFRDRIQQMIAAATGIVVNDNLAAKMACDLGCMFQQFYSLDPVKINGILKPKKDLGVDYIPGVTVWLDEKTSTTGR